MSQKLDPDQEYTRKNSHLFPPKANPNKLISIKFNGIIGWELWDKDKAPFIVNYTYISEEFKKELFGA